MWNNLRARHYAVLVLFAIVALETSAIAIDRLINRESDTAFSLDSPFQNNRFIQTFKVAEASSEKPATDLNNKMRSTPAKAVEKSVQKTVNKNAKLETVKAAKQNIEKSVQAKFIAATNQKPDEKVYLEYSVQPGDSLSHIAKLFGSNTSTLKSTNKLQDKHIIKVGQTIKVPMPAEEMTYSVKPGDSLSKIANRFRVPLKRLIAQNSLKTHRLQPQQKIRIPVKKTARDMVLISNRKTIKNAEKKLAKIDTPKPELIQSKPRLTKVGPTKLTKVQFAAAPATKPDIKFVEKELMKDPPILKTTVKQKSENSPKPSKKTSKDIKATEVTKTKVASKKTEKKSNPFVYKVKKGDNLLRISHRYDTTVAQIKTENNLNSNLLRIGDKLKISPGKKLYRVVKKSAATPKTKIVNYKVKKGDCLSIIARRHRTTITAIVDQNKLKSTIVAVGQTLKVPVDKKKYRVTGKRSTVARKLMTMPVRGRLSSGYGWRKHPVYRKRLFHAGIDLAAPKGTPIKAAKSGKVIYAGRRAGYGNLVIIRHSSGYSTRYGHCSKILVKKGQQVKSGQLIARVGATGVATGNHLHFEIRKNGKTVNPQTYLK